MKKNIKALLQIAFILAFSIAACTLIFFEEIVYVLDTGNSYDYIGESADTTPAANSTKAEDNDSTAANAPAVIDNLEESSTSYNSIQDDSKPVKTDNAIQAAVFSENKETEKPSEEKVLPPISSSSKAQGLHESMFYTQLPSQKVQCSLCFRKCTIDDGKRGFCRARQNIDGKLYSLTYGRPAAVHIDPIEKIPLSHVLPGNDSLCIGTAACNLRCLNCINWEFALKAPEEVESVSASPEEIIKMAKDNNLKIICFTYNEPTICYEYMTDIFKLARKEGIKTVLHSNASMNPEPLEALLPYVDAVAADLKGFDEEFYKDNCSSELGPVLTFLKTVKKNGVWLEVINLVIPGRSDSGEMIKSMSSWFKENLGSDTPLQFSRFFPTHKLSNLPPTPIRTLEDACKIASDAGLYYVYMGNVPGSNLYNTYCPDCKELLVERKGLVIRTFNIENGKCRFCGKEIDGMWPNK